MFFMAKPNKYEHAGVRLGKKKERKVSVTVPRGKPGVFKSIKFYEKIDHV